MKLPHAIRYGRPNDGENPIFAVRQSTKRKRVTEPLEATEFRALMLELPQKMRVIGIVAATTGLRISEVLGLKWMDIDWKTLQMDVTRSVVDGIVGKCKTETSRRPVPIDEFTAAESPALEAKNLLRGAGRLGLRQRTSSGERPPGPIRFWIASSNPLQSGPESRSGLASIPSGTLAHSTLLKANGKMSKWCRN